MSYFYLDAKEFERVVDAISKFSDGAVAERIINDYLHTEGGRLIKENIQKIIPVSGRTWNGKKTAASQTDPFTLKEENLAVIVKTKGPYHYLYFPDDGSNTQHHFGNQQFMFDGANASEDKIVNEVIDELVKRLEEI